MRALDDYVPGSPSHEPVFNPPRILPSLTPSSISSRLPWIRPQSGTWTHALPFSASVLVITSSSVLLQPREYFLARSQKALGIQSVQETGDQSSARKEGACRHVGERCALISVSCGQLRKGGVDRSLAVTASWRSSDKTKTGPTPGKQSGQTFTFH